jgi:NADPH-dependent 7-cyano-7-deazaguanine reductase QueF
MKRQLMVEQEKLDVFINNFGKLEESRKDYIQKLIQKLVEIHCNREFSGIYCTKEQMRRGNIGINPV